MSQNHDSRSVRFTTMLVVLALALGALALAGCGGTKESPGGPSGTGAPGNVKYVSDATKAEVLGVLRQSYDFGPDFVWVIDTGKAGTVLVKGAPMQDKKSKADYSEITMVKGADGKWAVTATK